MIYTIQYYDMIASGQLQAYVPKVEHIEAESALDAINKQFNINASSLTEANSRLLGIASIINVT